MGDGRQKRKNNTDETRDSSGKVAGKSKIVETMQVLFAYHPGPMPTSRIVTEDKVHRMLHRGGIQQVYHEDDRLTLDHLAFAEHTRYYLDEYGPTMSDGRRLKVHTIRGEGRCHWVRVGPPIVSDSERGIRHFGWRLIWGALQKEVYPKEVACIFIAMQHPMRPTKVQVPYVPSLETDPVHMKRLVPGHYALLGELKKECFKLTREKMWRLTSRKELQELPHELTTSSKSDFLKDVKDSMTDRCIAGVMVGEPVLICGSGGYWVKWGLLSKEMMEEADELETWSDAYTFTQEKRDCRLGFITFWVSDWGVAEVDFYSEENPGSYSGLSGPMPQTLSQSVRVNKLNAWGTIGREDYLHNSGKNNEG